MGWFDSKGEEKPLKGSKSKVLFCSKPRHMYTDPETFDGADLSPILLPNDRFMEVVDRFPYLGDMVARDGGDALAVDARVEAGSKAFGSLRGCIFSSSAVSPAALTVLSCSGSLHNTLCRHSPWICSTYT